MKTDNAIKYELFMPEANEENVLSMSKAEATQRNQQLREQKRQSCWLPVRELETANTK